MKSTFYIILTLITLTKQVTFALNQSLRFTINGQRCIFPTQHDGKEYTDCMLDEKGNEWCYVDKFGASYNHCARGNFDIQSTMLIKNIGLADNIEYCLFEHNGRVYSTQCDIMLEFKKRGLGSDMFEFFWINERQIKTKGQQCIYPVETPVIEGNRMTYYGYLEVRNCTASDTTTVKRVKYGIYI
jgi:hypothetical protein